MRLLCRTLRARHWFFAEKPSNLSILPNFTSLSVSRLKELKLQEITGYSILGKMFKNKKEKNASTFYGTFKVALRRSHLLRVTTPIPLRVFSKSGQIGLWPVYFVAAVYVKIKKKLILKSHQWNKICRM